MEIVYAKRIFEIKKGKKHIEKKLNVKLTFVGNRVRIEGEVIDEYYALQIIEAIGFGFDFRKALFIANEDYIFRRVRIKDHTNRRIRDTKSRLIGTRGKTRETLSEISGCEILIKESEVGIIGYVEDADNVVTAIISLIKGSKPSNVYMFLEKINRLNKNKEFIE